MTPEQQKLAADNHGLIIKLLIKHGLDVDEYYGDMAIAFCYAARAYRPETGYAFSTFAYRCMKNSLMRLWQKEGRQHRALNGAMVSLDELVFADDEMTSRINNVQALAGTYGSDETNIIVREFCDALAGTEAIVLRRYLEGFKSGYIAKELGMTKQNVHLIRNKLQKKWRAYAS